nr:hypothetical protein GCM10025699_04880 [Microbacterium flavescens]
MRPLTAIAPSAKVSVPVPPPLWRSSAGSAPDEKSVPATVTVVGSQSAAAAEERRPLGRRGGDHECGRGEEGGEGVGDEASHGALLCAGE